MSYADQLFINMCHDILEHGTSTEGERFVLNGKTEALHIQSNDSE